MNATDHQTTAAYYNLRARVEALAVELPGLTFGYIGNCGVDRRGPFDDRGWAVLLPHPGRVGTVSDRVSLGSTFDLPGVDWDKTEAAVRRLYGHQRPRT